LTAVTSHRDRHPLRVGALLWPQKTTWKELREAVLLADVTGLDSLWTWDHLHAIVGDPDQGIFEGWALLAAWAAITERATLGLMVGANTIRNPGLTAKAAVTVDHLSGGRAWLGIGGAWFEHEHVAHGIEFGRGFGERLNWLDEAVAAIAALLRGEDVTSPDDGHYRFRDLRHRPLPVRGPGLLPIMIGGGGEKKTLRTVARHAAGWNISGSLETMKRKVDVLAGHCAEVGRDMTEIEFTLGQYVCRREDDPDPAVDFLGPEERVAEMWRPYLELGFTHLIPELAAPFDRETIERLARLRALMAGSSPGGTPT
jgi:alkanesulfonate monooxygenase SsuD/methylene tetrahydromethanopterin reductase-like flavin-dependent oxidoreductase (luciferase family)